ncbi:unnamed protein product [Nyctereutes procyonoides]|uniref:(raccoon dog) hypothetical protein n=1 Tax=Nyctereutes procyonoides TaxID=34880 RepID=A0A811XZT2_NYCPR|nr:unnamed protein product [Nyctereutes procyonoides]
MAQLRVDTQLVTLRPGNDHSSRPHRPRGSRGGTGVLLCTAWGAAAWRPGPFLSPPVPATGEASPSRALPAWPRPRVGPDPVSSLPARPRSRPGSRRRSLLSAFPPGSPGAEFQAPAAGAGLSRAGPRARRSPAPRGLPARGLRVVRLSVLLAARLPLCRVPGVLSVNPRSTWQGLRVPCKVPSLVKPYAEKPIKTTWTADLHNCEMIRVGLLGYMVTTFTCGRVSRECQDLPPGDLLSHQELLWKLCQTDPKKNYEKLKVLWLSYVKFWKSVTTGGEQVAIQLPQRGDTSRQEKGIQTPGLVQFAFYPSPSQVKMNRKIPSGGV